MLADQIPEYVGSPYAEQFGTAALRELRKYESKVKQAPRFVLERDAVFLIEDLMRTVMPSRIHSALNLCRLPYPTMWIEFVFKDRSDWVSIARAQGMVKDRDWENEPDAPSRLGYLLEETHTSDGYGIEFHPVWKFNHVPIINMCTQSLSIDLEPRPPLTPSPEEMRDFQKTRGKNAWAMRWHGRADDELAAFDIEKRIEMFIPPFMKPIIDYTRQNLGERAAREMIASATYDLAGEWRFILALLMVLNSRNVISFGPEETFDKLNKQRKKSGKEPLLSHRPITLHLSRVQTNRMGNIGMGRSSGDVRNHLVRGHWKLRKSGLFFWSKHERGHGNDSPAPIYSVRA